jgi:serine/threonine protein kinase
VDGAAPPLPDAEATRNISAAPPAPDPEATLDISRSSRSRTESATSAEGKTIGPYRLIRKLGEGGMGQVWLAEQTAPVRRQVALKLIKVGIYDDSVLKRFQAERQSLAIMDHPSIAKVFDAGATPDGQPYFVMEYVAGVPITNYCDQKKLNIRERLELFIKVCDGVQHAHQKAVIHRDLKPANILVVEVDGKPTPRIIDFGLSKVTGPQVAGENVFTQVGSFVGTPGYMSPEQADSSFGGVDTRTDVYSLGVVLYVLLAGSPPFDPKQWKTKPFYEMVRRLREEDPPPPSAKLGMEKEPSLETAECRGLQPQQLVKLLHGDLDWMVMKAMERDRARRYGTPSELAAEIQRYLNHEPLVARPASASYRLQKYVRRHRIGVAFAGGLLLLLIGVAVMQALQVRRVTHERDRATRITDFMTGMYKVSDPSEARGNSITAREILDKSSKEIETGLAKDPETQAQMMDVMGNVYGSLGLYPRAQPLLERAVDIQRRILGPRNPETLKSISDLGWLLTSEGRYIDAEKLDRETLEIRRQTLGRDNPDTLRSMNHLAWDLQQEGHYPEAERLERDAIDTARRVLGPEHPITLATIGALGVTLGDEGRYPEEEKVERDELDIRRRALGPDHPDTLTTIGNLAATITAEGRYAEAEKLYREELDTARRVLGPEHPVTMVTFTNLAATIAQEGRYAEAEKLQREAIDIDRRVLGPEHPDTVRIMDALAQTLQDEGRYTEAEKMARETIEIQRRVLGPEHVDTLRTMRDLAWSVQGEGHNAEAEKIDRELLDTQLHVFGPEHPETLATAGSLAAVLEEEGRYAEAEGIERELLDTDRRVLGPENPITLAATTALSDILGKEGHYAEAEKLGRMALDANRRVLGHDNPGMVLAVYNLGCWAARQGHKSEALAYLREAIDHGLSPADDLDIDKDADLKSLHGDPQFEALVAYAKERAAAAQKSH